MSPLLVGTAGHVDHGKTALLRALTGIDCDRLPEEKRRGITLDLGFAHLERDGVEIGFVDVPGHERFLHNALAGLGAVRLVLLVVGADEGVRAQTREHLAVVDLLGAPELVVALTKIDLVDEDTAELAELEIEELVAATRFAGAPVFRVSGATGAGVEALADALLERARRPEDASPGDDPARLPIDRAFVVRGQGVVVTGSLLAGRVGAGDALRLEPLGLDVRVRSVEAHGRARERVGPGSRTAVLLGGVEASAVARGQELVGPGGPEPTRRWLARVRLLDGAPALEGSREVRVHLLAAERVARIRPLRPERIAPGGDGLGEIRLAAPTPAVRGDRLVLRRPSPAATLGGGTILDPRWRARRRAALDERLEALAGDDLRALGLWIADRGAAGASSAELARRLGRAAPAVEARLAPLAAEGRLLSGAGRWFEPAALVEIERRARAAMAAYLERERLAEGMPRAELARTILPRTAHALGGFHLDWLARRGVLELDGEVARPPGRRPVLSGAERGLAGRLLELYADAGLEPPSPAEAARRLDAKPEIALGLVRHLVKQGELLQLSGGLLISAAVFRRLADDLAATGWERFNVGQFKERFGLSRKFAIPLLERLDGEGFTRREGEQRRLLRLDTR